MERQSDSVLNQESIDFAGNYIADHFKAKNSGSSEKHIILNTVAHGYSMGYRRCEEVAKKHIFFRKFGMFFEPKSVAWVHKDSVKAAKFYIKKKKFSGLPTHELALIKAALSYGFKNGYDSRSKV